jgi:hypothetical protein
MGGWGSLAPRALHPYPALRKSRVIRSSAARPEAAVSTLLGGPAGRSPV